MINTKSSGPSADRRFFVYGAERRNRKDMLFYSGRTSLNIIRFAATFSFSVRGLKVPSV